MVRIKLNGFLEFPNCILPVSESLLGSTELKSNGVDVWVEVGGLAEGHLLGWLQSFYGIFVFSQPQIGASHNVESCYRIRVQAYRLLGFLYRARAPICYQKGIGEVQV